MGHKFSPNISVRNNLGIVLAKDRDSKMISIFQYFPNFLERGWGHKTS